MGKNDDTVDPTGDVDDHRLIVLVVAATQHQCVAVAPRGQFHPVLDLIDVSRIQAKPLIRVTGFPSLDQCRLTVSAAHTGSK